MFGRILLFLFPLVLIADIYIYMIFIRKLTKKLPLRILWFLPSALLLLGVYIFFFSGIRSDFREAFIIAYIVLAIPKIFFFIISLLDIPFRIIFKKWKIYPFTIVASFVSLAIVFIVLYGGLAGKERIVVKEVEFSSPNLPQSFNGYRIVQISDLHIGNWEGNRSPIVEMVEKINNEMPDIVMVTGDLVHHAAAELDGYEDILSVIKAKDGVYSILGNHDYGPYRRWESKEKEMQNLQDLKQRQAGMGWKLLNNENTYLVKGNDSIALIGVENDGAPPHFSKHGDLPKAMKGTKDSDFKLLLSHDPTHWRREVLDTDIDLMLSGHTHGAQFILGPFSFASFVYDEWAGLYKEGKQGLYINVGMGHVGIPFRFGAFPEITVITLKKE